MDIINWVSRQSGSALLQVAMASSTLFDGPSQYALRANKHKVVFPGKEDARPEHDLWH